MKLEDAQKLREPFPENAVGKLPRISCRDCSDAQGKACSRHHKAKCADCGNYITPAHVHLDYVGHAAVTDRLLAVDPEWTWEPVAFGPDGAPLLQRQGNEARMWIRLTVLGVTRYGVGIASGFELEKQLIGDAIRNAAMRFGVALDLWSKEDLRADDVDAEHHEADARDYGYEVAPKATISALQQRVAALPAHEFEGFSTWKDDQGFPWPWPVEAVEAMNAELDRRVSGAGESVGEDESSPAPDLAELELLGEEPFNA